AAAGADSARLLGPHVDGRRAARELPLLPGGPRRGDGRLLGSEHSDCRPRAMTRATTRCAWVGADPLYVAYHDREWGGPVHDDVCSSGSRSRGGAPPGLPGFPTLRKGETSRRASARFDPKRVARFGPRDVRRLLADPGLVRNRLKIESAIRNAKAFLAVQDEFGSFDRFQWQFVGGRPKRNAWASGKQVPARTPESDALSQALRQRGFTFVGSTICYAHMQAVGMVNDHTTDCFRYPAGGRGGTRA